MLDQQKEVFQEEAAELLAELEASLMELEDAPDDADLVGKVFRAMHTIKGSGAMFGFEAIAAFTHEVETVFDRVRNGELAVSKQLINLALAARDHIASLLAAADGGEIDTDRGVELVAALQALVPGDATGDAATGGAAAEPSTEIADQAENDEATYRIRLRVEESLIFTGTRPDALLRELAELGTCRVIAQTADIPLLDQLNAENCHVHWDLILTTARGLNAIRDVFIFVEDTIDLQIDLIDDGQNVEADADYKRIGEILFERGDISRQELDAILAEEKPFGQKLIDTGKVHADRLEAALQEQNMVRSARSRRQAAEATSSVRVPADRLDTLVNMVGELVTLRARLSQCAAEREDSELTMIAEEVERLTDELRDVSLNMRMLPIGTTFSKFKRLVRDLSSDLGKEVELKTAGAETEIDKTVIEKLNDPLVHLIRNSLDHGIEAPEVRRRAGKPAVGTVTLAAAHAGDSVEITIQDDGQGLDRDAIFAKGVEKELIAADASLSDSEIYNLIFAAGFSTARQVTGVSGRGVGMDVVKRAIDALRGSIRIDSAARQGSTITIRLPLTLAIIESLLVQVADESYALPLASVEECVELPPTALARAHGRNLINVREQIVPYVPLREAFLISDAPPALQQVVITNLNGNRVGFVVDQVIGQHQSVIKTLGRVYKDVKGISGATILGDGKVALILDIGQLSQQAA